MKNPIIDIGILKEYLDIEDTDNLDNKLSNLINAVTTYFDNQTNRILSSQTHTEVYHGDGGLKLWVDNYPISSVTSIHSSTDTPRSYIADNLIDSDNYAYDKDLPIIYLLDGWFDKGFNTIQVVYTAGYTTIPEDLQQAALDVCAQLWKQEQGGLQQVSNITVPGGGSVNFLIDKAVGAFAKSVINYYKRGVSC